MGFINRLRDIVGLIRIYSLLDLILLLIAIGANKPAFIGVVFLHISFLFFLEHSHKHKYRAVIPTPFPYFWCLIFLIVGLVFYRNIAVLGFLLFSFLYTLKKKGNWGYFAPFFRGMQLYFLVAGIVGFLNPLAFLSFGLLTIRNFTGDLRDITKDKKEKRKTLPMILGFKKSIKNIHLILLFITIFIWWYLAKISVWWLLLVFVLQVTTYNLTSR